MVFEQTYQTNWHDTNSYGFVTPSRVLTYLQETGSRQCRACHMDLDELYREKQQGFLLSRLRLTMYAPLRAYEDITVHTWCPPSRGLTFLRCFRMIRNGVTIAEAASTWAFMDGHTHTLLNVSDFHGDFPVDDPVDEASLPKPVRLSASLPMEVAGERRIVFSDLDFNRHMNNTRYPDMVCDFLPPDAMAGRYLSQMSLSYMREAPFGCTLTVSRLPIPDTDGGWWLRASREEAEVCFEAEMRFQKA